jgi:hypothetical protein
LTLRTAPVLDGADTEMVAQRVEQGQRHARLSGRDRHGSTVEGELEGVGSQEKLCPQPQLREAFGFVMAKPDCSRVSL